MHTLEAVPTAGMSRPEPRPRAPGDEAALLARVRRGERAAAEELVDATYPMVYRSLLRLCGDRETAEDLTQEAFARAWRSLKDFRGQARFSTWMYRIAYTSFLNHIRRPQRHQLLEAEQAEALPDPTAVDPDLAIDGEHLRRAVLSLPEDLRFTVTARYWSELTVRDIARAEGLTTVAIRKRLRRALRLLADSLEEVPS
jgi:RNA polymerase sigma-70 factor (ECF subfamily)